MRISRKQSIQTDVILPSIRTGSAVKVSKCTTELQIQDDLRLRVILIKYSRFDARYVESQRTLWSLKFDFPFELVLLVSSCTLNVASHPGTGSSTYWPYLM